MTAFKKVSVKERLPYGEAFCINKDGKQGLGWLNVNASNMTVYCSGLSEDSEVIECVEFWLEEIELPTVANNSLLEMFK